MPLEGYDDLPRDMKNVIESDLGDNEKVNKKIGSLLASINQSIKDSLRELKQARELREEFIGNRKKLKESKKKELESLLAKNPKTKTEYEALDKAGKKKFLDEIGDELDKGQLAHLKKAIKEFDQDIAKLNKDFKELYEIGEEFKNINF